MRETSTYVRVRQALSRILDDASTEELDSNTLNYLANTISIRASVNRRNKSYEYIRKLMRLWFHMGVVDTRMIDKNNLTPLQHKHLMNELQNLLGDSR